MDLLHHLFLVCNPERLARGNGEGHLGLGVIASGAKHLTIGLAVMRVRIIARDDMIDFDASPSGETAGPAAIALSADGLLGGRGELVALRHVSISCLWIYNTRVRITCQAHNAKK